MNAIPRVALVWLLVAQVLVILPHLAYMPLWIAAMWLGCAAWRVQVFRMRAGYPRAWVKLALALLAGAGVWLSRGSLVGLDAGAVLLIAAFILKLVEMKTRRDALVLVFLGFFAVVVGYLFDDGFLAALYSLLPVTALLAALIGLQQSAFASRPWPTLRLAGGLLLQALPLMLLLFLFFPRLGPLWSLPMPGNKGVTGLSESMAPGDIAELGRSAELAFRVRFEGAPPPREQLYWRALTMERFDGRRWAQAPQWPGEDALHWQKRGPELRYDVIMQPSSQPWLFALDVAQTDQTDTRLMSDFHLQRRQPVEQRLFYRASSWPQALRESSIDPRMRWRNLQLPMHGNPRARALAEQLRQAHGATAGTGRGPVAALQPRALRLHPGNRQRPGADGVDDFLFDTRSGFCAHYAGAMAFVLRAAGIPARVVGRLPGRRAESGGQLPAGASVRRPRLGRILAAGAGLAERRPRPTRWRPNGSNRGWSRPWPGTASTSPTHRCRRCATVACPGSTTCVWPGTA
ncbi:transglutaminase [Pseudomonas aeruginosa]|nr:transglutaminase [Pseudomonas aeruginosa]